MGWRGGPERDCQNTKSQNNWREDIPEGLRSVDQTHDCGENVWGVKVFCDLEGRLVVSSLLDRIQQFMVDLIRQGDHSTLDDKGVRSCQKGSYTECSFLDVCRPKVTQEQTTYLVQRYCPSDGLQSSCRVSV